MNTFIVTNRLTNTNSSSDVNTFINPNIFKFTNTLIDTSFMTYVIAFSLLEYDNQLDNAHLKTHRLGEALLHLGLSLVYIHLKRTFDMRFKQ